MLIPSSSNFIAQGFYRGLVNLMLVDSTKLKFSLALYFSLKHIKNIQLSQTLALKVDFHTTRDISRTFTSTVSA